MNRINELIRQHCPNGAEFLPLGTLCLIKTGPNVNKKFISDNPGEYPVINSGKEPLGFVNEWNTENDPIGIASRGSVGHITWSEGKYFRGNLNYSCTVKNDEILSARYLFHLLHNMQDEIQLLATHEGIPALNKGNLEQLQIPIPPLEVQKEIVNVLDAFAEMESKLAIGLEAELEARQQQYMHYSYTLLNPKGKTNVKWTPLGEVCELKRGNSITKKNIIEGDVPVIAGGQQPAYYHGKSNRDGETITIAGSGAYAGFVNYWQEPIFVSDAFSVKPDNSLLLTKYVYYFLKNSQNALHALKKGFGVPHVYPKDVAKISIPVRPLKEQKYIVDILDKFDALINDISEGLPAEIVLRRQQYEHYRNQLLSFKETN